MPETLLNPEQLKADQAPDTTASANTTYTFDFADGVWHKVTVSSDCTFAFTFPSGRVEAMVLEIVDGGGSTITWPVGMEFEGGVAPSLTASGTDHLVVYQDESNNLYLSVISLNVS